MKLATLKDGSRDGQLVVVSRDLSLAHHASGIATRLQQVLDDWNFLSPQLEDLYATLNGGKARHAFPFEPRQCMAPLPRAYQWADASGYLQHVALVRRARGVEMPADAHLAPLMYQGGSDDLLGPTDDARFLDEEAGIDFEAELAVVTGDIPMGAGPDQALDGVRLLMLVNDWTCATTCRPSWPSGFGFVQSKPATAFGPVALTPDELGDAWRGGRVHLPLQQPQRPPRRPARRRRGHGLPVRRHPCPPGAHACRCAPAASSAAAPSAMPTRPSGCGCIAEQRARELLDGGSATTDYLRFGDTVRIEVMGRDGQSLFGAIDQRVVGPGGAGTPPAEPGPGA
jgi:fumarylacetoacetate (FAA) hydrolase